MGRQNLKNGQSIGQSTKVYNIMEVRMLLNQKIMLGQTKGQTEGIKWADKNVPKNIAIADYEEVTFCGRLNYSKKFDFLARVRMY